MSMLNLNDAQVGSCLAGVLYRGEQAGDGKVRLFGDGKFLGLGGEREMPPVQSGDDAALESLHPAAKDGGAGIEEHFCDDPAQDVVQRQARGETGNLGIGHRHLPLNSPERAADAAPSRPVGVRR